MANKWMMMMMIRGCLLISCLPPHTHFLGFEVSAAMRKGTKDHRQQSKIFTNCKGKSERGFA